MKKIFLSVWLTLLVNVFCLPMWTECDYGGFIRTLFNKEARLDLLYSGKITGAEPFQYDVTPVPSHSSWMYETGNNIHQVNLSLRTRGKWQKFSLQLKAQRDGKITILFRGPDVHDEYGSFYSVLTDWCNIKINGKTILPKEQAFSFMEHFTKQLSVKKGDVLHIEAEFRRHHFLIHDFTGLKSGKIWYIITGNLLVFFLIYRLLSCVRGGIRRADALFLATVFLLSFIPVINISDAVESARENRTLAKKPELKDLFKGNSDYGKRYDNWFNDHFCGRVSLTKLHDVLRNKISYMIKGRRAIYFKESGWLFSPVLVNPRNLDASFTDSIVYNIVKLNTFCIKNKIKLYILEVPRKESVYKDLIAQKYGFPEEQYNKLERVRDIIKAKILKHSIPYIYPYDDLQKASERGNYVFFKWSHHWTDYGAFIGYCELMKEIRKDFPNMPFVSLNNYQESQNQLIRDDWNRYYWLGFTECLLNFNDDPSNRSIYNYYDHRNGEKMAAQVGEFTKDFTYPEGKYKVMLVGTSQNENFLQFLPYSAAKTKYIRLNMRQTKTSDKFKILKLYKKDILAFKPDILILSISTGHLPGLRDLCSTK